MTGRERVRSALAHQTPDRVPMGMVCAGINEPARSEFDAYLRTHRGITLDAFLLETIDIAEVEPAYTGPSLPAGTDYWGVGRTAVRQAAGGEYDEIIRYPLRDAESAADLASHRWPSPDWFDYTVIPRRIEQALGERERAVMTLNGNIFETSWYMRGLDTMMMDFLLRPDVAHAVAERVTSFFLEYFDRILTAGEGEIDLVFTADDLGGQGGLLLSREMWETFIKPYHVRLNELIHSHGAKIIYHTDGAVSEVVDGLVDMGIDVLQALQFDAAGMDPSDLKARFGERLCFEGGVSVQRTLPHGTPEAVRAEVTHLVETLGRGGGYVVGPSHWIQAGTPAENIMAMFDAAR